MRPDQVKVDLYNKTVYIGKTEYQYEPGYLHRIWYRMSKKYAYVGHDKVLIKELKEAESRGEGPDDGWDPVGLRVKDSHKLKQLDKIVNRALKREMRRRRHKLKQRLKKVHRQPEASLEEDPPQQDEGPPKRTKWGLRIYSSDGKHFFNLGCWKSFKYPGKASIRLGRYLYTVSQSDLKAVLEELRRGLQPKTSQEPK